MGMNNKTVRLPNRIWHYMKRGRYSQRDISYLLGYKSASNLSRWQNGTKTPTLDNAIGLSVALCISVDALFPEHRRYWEDRVNRRRERLLSRGYPQRSEKLALRGKK